MLVSVEVIVLTKARKIVLVTSIAIGIFALIVVAYVVFNQNIQANVLKERIKVSAEQMYDEEYTEYIRQLYSDIYDFDGKRVVAYQVDVDNQTLFTFKRLKCYLNFAESNIFLLGSDDLVDGYLDLEPNNDFGGIYYFAVPKQLSNDEMCSIINDTDLVLSCKVLWKEMMIYCRISVKD